MEHPTVLIVEDDARVLQFIKQGLEENGFKVVVAQDGESGWKLARAQAYDAVVLDVMLPRMRGSELCRRIREHDAGARILMLTALGTLNDKLDGFKAGADDYLVKPFAFPELLARVQALLRRRHGATATGDSTQLQLADLELDLLRRRALRAGQRIDLSAKEFKLLALLLSRQGQVLSRTELASLVWDMNFDSETNVVEVAIRRLRAKLDAPFAKPLLHTVRGMGYVLEEREP